MEINLKDMLASLQHTHHKSTEGTWRGWKITAKESYRDHNGHLAERDNPRCEMVKHFLYENYRIEVESRYKTLLPMDKAKFNKVVDFLTVKNGKCGLILYGTTGTGKSTYLNAISNTIFQLYADEIHKNSFKVFNVKASEIGKTMKDYKEEYNAIKRSAVLLIDDIGFSGEAEMVNDYGIKTNPLVDIIEHRYDKQLFTVFTTNLTETEIRELYGQRIHSRLNEMCVWIGFGGKDYRI